MQRRLRAAAIANGATLVAPETVFLSYDTELGRDVIVEPNVVFGPRSKVHDGVNLVGQYEGTTWTRCPSYTTTVLSPPQPVGVALFYYDNEGDPEAETSAEQWGWRTRFWNLGVNANVAPGTKILAQAMTGSTIMGFPTNGQYWVHTDFSSAYVLAVHDFGKFALTGRIESFQTREHGDEMSPLNSEDGWAATAAVRVPIDRHFTVFGEVLNVESNRGTRVTQGGLSSPMETQTVFQLAVRAAL